MSEVPHYPTGVFPGILGEMQHKYGNTPKDAALSGPCLIAAGMIAASGVARCRRDESDGDMTINIAQIVIAPSGAGKSVHLRRSTHGIQTWEQKQNVAAQEQKIDKEVDGLVFQSKFSAVKKRMGREFEAGGDIDEHKKQLHLLLSNKPEKELSYALMQSDATTQAIIHSLNRSPVGAVVNAEGGANLDRLRAKDFPFLNSMLDGEVFTHSRVRTGTMKIRPYFSVLLMAQNEKYYDFEARCGAQMEAAGLSARNHPTFVPQNWVGSEILTEDNDADKECSRRFNTRIHDLLDTMSVNVRNGMTSLRVIENSPPSKVVLTRLRKENHELMQSREYEKCQRFIAKRIDHVIRLAGMWHVFEGREGDVSAEYVEAASEVLRYHLDVHRFLQSKPSRELLEENDAELLHTVLSRVMSHRNPPTRAQLMNLAFNVGISTTARFNNALGLLGAERQIEVDRLGRVHLIVQERRQMGGEKSEGVKHLFAKMMGSNRFD